MYSTHDSWQKIAARSLVIGSVVAVALAAAVTFAVGWRLNSDADAKQKSWHSVTAEIVKVWPLENGQTSQQVILRAGPPSTDIQLVRQLPARIPSWQPGGRFPAYINDDGQVRVVAAYLDSSPVQSHYVYYLVWPMVVVISLGVLLIDAAIRRSRALWPSWPPADLSQFTPA